MLDLKLFDYAWYYLYHAPRYKLDKRYRAKYEDMEALLRKAYERGILQ